MSRSWPALDARDSDPDLFYAALDDLAVTAIEERDDSLRAFFASAGARDAALAALAARFNVSPIDVPDEDWARRSQQDLTPVTIGRITIVPHPVSPIPDAADRESRPASRDAVTLTIPASMGFGTGHHATTRLCLTALQAIDLSGKTVLDVGTGSGVLAIAASRLGAARAIGIDFDPDAIQSARESLALNPEATNVSLEVGDLSTSPLPAADVITANLTGALLIRSAPLLLAAPNPGGVLVLSGLMRHERDAVCEAFGAAEVIWERHEDEWVGLTVNIRDRQPVGG
jgi:ribosomal protein L11 methyltransferase